MKRRYLKVIVLSCFFLLSSCTNEVARELKEKLSRPLQSPNASISLGSSSVAQYRDVELSYNENFVLRLKNLIDNSFEQQLEEFEDNELGFFASYGHMFNYLFLSNQKLNENWQVKSSKYFNSLDVEMKAAELYDDYLTDIKNIRANFYKSKNKKDLPEYKSLNLPKQDIYLGSLQEHSRNNFIIEVGVELLVWILVLGIIAIISLVIAVPTLGLSLIVTILTIIVSVVLSISNDNNLLNSLREQHISTQIEYTIILDKLNENTHNFYGR